MSDRQIISVFEQEFGKTKALCDGALVQTPDVALHEQINPNQNSVAVVMQHVIGNLRSRFTDFLSSDGEKPSRHRDNEFTDAKLSRAALIEQWEQAWEILFKCLMNMTDADLSRIVYIRKEPHTVLAALLRQEAHYAWHAAQIALLAKHFRGDGWRWMTIAPNESKVFNQSRGLV